MNEILELTQEQKEEFDKLYSNVTTNGGKVFTEDAQDILDTVIDGPDYPHLSDLLLDGGTAHSFNTQLLLLQAIKDPSTITVTEEARDVVLVPGTEHSYYCTNVGLDSLETTNSKSDASRLTLDDIKQLRLEIRRREQI